MGKLEHNRFAKNCDGKVCTCDFRIYVVGCKDKDIDKVAALRYLVFFTCIIVIISLSFLYYRVKVKKQSIFFPATKERGLIRPRPQDSFHIAVGAFNFSQMLVSTCLIMDLFPNVITAEIIANVPKLLGFTCAVLYPISIIYSTPILKQTSHSLKLQWNPNKFLIDALAIYLMLGPLLTIIPLAALTGDFADHENNDAYVSFMAQAFVWSCWTIQYLVTLLYVYYKLIRMLNGYVDILQRRRSENSDADMKIKKFKNAAHNLTWIVFAVFLMFFTSCLEGIIVGTHYKKKTRTPNDHTNASLIDCYFISWNFTIPVLSFIGQIIFLFDTLKNRKSQRNKNSCDRRNNIQSHIEQKPNAIIKDKSIISKSSKSSLRKSTTTTLSPSSNNYSTKKSISSIYSKTTIVSTLVGTSSLISKSGDFEKSRNNTLIKDWKSSDFDIDHYFEESDESKDVTSAERKSWLNKKPIRNLIPMKDSIDRNLFQHE